jgi:hypothetical protein
MRRCVDIVSRKESLKGGGRRTGNTGEVRKLYKSSGTCFVRRTVLFQLERSKRDREQTQKKEPSFFLLHKTSIDNNHSI